MENDFQYKITSNGRQPPMEQDLHWKETFNGRLPQIKDDLQFKTTFNEEDLQWKMTSKARWKWNINHIKDINVYVLRWKLEGNSEDISSVALLSPACF